MYYNRLVCRGCAENQKIGLDSVLKKETAYNPQFKLKVTKNQPVIV